MDNIYYLDNNATTKMDDRVFVTMALISPVIVNDSTLNKSTHNAG
jgi:cysteine sulfinate desulfinase/cysteine desulfurase-like protein